MNTAAGAPLPATSPMTPTTSAVVPRLLAEYGQLTSAAVQRCLQGGEPRKHLYDLIADYPARGGKMMRSGLCIATAKAFGARLDEVIGSAVAIELLHNALLIHDDIEDESALRRGQPTLHEKHGVALAINAGDMLSLMSLGPLLGNRHSLGNSLSLRILDEARRMARESAEGQAMELGWRFDNVVELADEDYLVMVLKKTCWFTTAFPVRIGALIGTRGTVALEPLLRFGFFLGAAFQIQDDLLNLVADARYGKERDGDIWEGKRTLMLLHLYREAEPEERERLHALLALPRTARPADEVGWVRRRMDDYGSLDYARGIAHGLAGAAQREFEQIFSGLPDSPDKQFIGGLTTWVFERT